MGIIENTSKQIVLYLLYYNLISYQWIVHVGTVQWVRVNKNCLRKTVEMQIRKHFLHKQKGVYAGANIVGVS